MSENRAIATMAGEFRVLVASKCPESMSSMCDWSAWPPLFLIFNLTKLFLNVSNSLPNTIPMPGNPETGTAFG